MSNSSTAATELAELARTAAWGLVKGGDLDSFAEDGKAALLERLDILEAAQRAGVPVDLDAHGIGRIYIRAEVESAGRNGEGKPRRKVHRITIETEGMSDQDAAALHHALITVAGAQGHLHNYNSTSLVSEIDAAKQAADYTYSSKRSPNKIEL
ncbi:hypothetical protein [Mycolicibacterium fortuitum]|uniref:hypothetical protein n=1 Tax=Mycolicibacterium fortuitum TaxID=1766 RepID=UPI0026302B6A|nr:hypothetical protein [Mycolicibacterium fortuitum]